MRSELPWLESRSPWQRLGPTLLGLAIIGVGMGGAIRIVRAQDNFPTTPAVQPKPDVQITAKVSTDPFIRVSQDDQVTSKQLDELLRQRADLDARISDLRRHLRSADRTRSGSNNDSRRVAPRTEIDPTSPEWRSAIDEARQQARDAMQQAREAMRAAQDALREAQRSASRVDGGKDPFGAPIPRMPTPPQFQFDFKAPDKLDSESMKRFQEQWQKMQPQFEQQMRDFQKRMEEWQRSFEAQQRQMEKQLRDQKYRRVQPDKPSAEPKETKESDDAAEAKEIDEPKTPARSSDRSTNSDSDNDNEPL